MNLDIDEQFDKEDEIARMRRGLENDCRDYRSTIRQLEQKVAQLESDKNELAAALLRMRDEQAAKMLKAAEAMGPTFTPVPRAGAASPAAAAVAAIREKVATIPGLHGLCSALATLELGLIEAADLARRWELLVGQVDLTGDIPFDLINEGERHASAFRAAEAQLEKAVL